MNNSMEANYMEQASFNPRPGMMPQRPQCGCSQEIRRLENRIFNLEREVNRLRSRVSRIENNIPTMTPYRENNYTSDYNPNNYNMM